MVNERVDIIIYILITIKPTSPCTAANDDRGRGLDSAPPGARKSIKKALSTHHSLCLDFTFVYSAGSLVYVIKIPI